MMHRILLISLTLFTLIFTTGCSVTPKYRVTVDAITAPNVALSPSSYTIKALDEKKDSNGILFKKYAQKLSEVMNQQGYSLSDNAQVAQQNIYFDYGLEKVDEETTVYSEPNISFGMSWGFPYGMHHNGMYYRRHYHPFFYDNFYGSYNTYTKTRIYYNRYLTLLAKDQSNKELWRVDVSSIGESKNLRKIIPLLIEAAAPYMGKNTAEPVKLVIKDKALKK